jgi:putative Mn2+ efflux pump MntP
MLAILLIALSLSMDAFAVSVTNGMTVRGFRFRHALIMGLYFGGFQFLMPLAGYFLAGTVSSRISRLGPYISFILLGFIGGKMIWEASKGDGSGGEACLIDLTHRRLLAMAVATSIDALAVGVSFAFMNVKLLLSCGIIGIVTFAVCVFGAVAGSRLPIKSCRNAEIAGGVVLIAIGVKILLEGVLG